MRKRYTKLSIAVAVILLIQMACASTSFAYFNRGTVELSLSQSSISVKEGSAATVSVSIDPIKEDQLPGCGMAECPQSCGNTGCLNENGECTCGGTTYQTYYSSVAVTSSDSSVASVSYANGTIMIKGHKAGNAVITATGSMRQYTEASKQISVTVTAQGGTAVQTSKNEVKTSDEEVSDVSVEEIQKDNTQKNIDESTDTESTEYGTLQDTKRGKYRMVELSDSTDIPGCFAKAEEEQSHLVFQHKSGENVLWSWTFDTAGISTDTDVSALNLDIQCSDTCPDGLAEKLKNKNIYYMNFAYNGKLPAEAEIYINAAAVFADTNNLYLYHADDASGDIELVSDGISAENGYATFSIDHCSDYFLCDSEIKAAAIDNSTTDSGNGYVKWIVGAVVIVVILAGVVLVIRKRKRSVQ